MLALCFLAPARRCLVVGNIPIKLEGKNCRRLGDYSRSVDVTTLLYVRSPSPQLTLAPVARTTYCC